MTPNDQMSHFSLYFSRFKISGPIVIGVPQYDSNRLASSRSFAKPKSAIFTVQSSESKRFASFKSQCTMWNFFNSRIAWLIYSSIYCTRISGKRWFSTFFKYCSKSPLLQYSKIKYQLFADFLKSSRLIMFLCFNTCKI